MKHIKELEIKQMAYITICLLVLVFIALVIIRTDDVDESIRSSSLQEIKIKDGEKEITVYKDENGQLTYASDRNFATCIKTPFYRGCLVEYYNEKGAPAEQSAGYYAIEIQYNENDKIEKRTYLGIDHKPVMITTGYSIAKYNYNDADRIRETRYYDVKGEPINTYSFGYGCIEQYNEKNQIISTTYIDDSGKPTVVGQGFAVVQMQYYDSGDSIGKTEFAFYFDEKEQPIQLSLGQYGVHIEYDEFGRERKRTYLDQNGEPFSTVEGYTTVTFTRYEDDSIKTETYYDQAGMPAQLSEGQYGKQHMRNGEIKYLDRNGKVMINIKQSLYNNELFVIISCVFSMIISSLANKKFNYLLLVMYIFAIIYMTLLYRNRINTSDISKGVIDTLKQIFTSYEKRKEIYNNILLFIPFGTILYRLYPRSFILILPILFSAVIEGIQLYTKMGYCELLDFIANSTGGAIGFYIEKKLKGLVNSFSIKSKHTL